MECHVVLFDTYSPNYRELDKSRHDENLENMYQITPRGTPMNLSLLLNQLECTI